MVMSFTRKFKEKWTRARRIIRGTEKPAEDDNTFLIAQLDSIHSWFGILKHADVLSDTNHIRVTKIQKLIREMRAELINEDMEI